jgi:hypothetical protein
MKTRGWIIVVAAAAFLFMAVQVAVFLFSQKTSNDILTGFKQIDETLKTTGSHLDSNTNKIISLLADSLQKRALLVKKLSDSAYNQIGVYKMQIAASDGITTKNNFTDFRDEAKKIKELLVNHKSSLQVNFPDLDLTKLESRINTADCTNDNGPDEKWETCYFYHLPLAAVITNLTKIQSDIRNVEADLISQIADRVTNVNTNSSPGK